MADSDIQAALVKWLGANSPSTSGTSGKVATSSTDETRRGSSQGMPEIHAKLDAILSRMTGSSPVKPPRLFGKKRVSFPKKPLPNYVPGKRKMPPIGKFKNF